MDTEDEIARAIVRGREVACRLRGSADRIGAAALIPWRGAAGHAFRETATSESRRARALAAEADALVDRLVALARRLDTESR